MRPKISIIIATKNEEKNIARCIKSVKKQKYTWNETIVVDNYSKDKTVEIAKRYTPHVYLKGPERSAQRNFGASKAKGDILVFLDADMEMKSVQILSEISKLYKKFEKKSFIIPESSDTSTVWDKLRGYYRNFVEDDAFVEAPRVFARRNFIEVGGYDEDLNACEDWNLRDKISSITEIGRIKNSIIHHENISSLPEHLREKFYYAQYLALYLKKKNTKTLNPQTVFFLRPSFLKMLRSFPTHPIMVLGSTLLLASEALFGFFGYWYGIRKFRSKLKSFS